VRKVVRISFLPIPNRTLERMMSNQDKDEYLKYVAKRVRQLLRSDAISLPGLSWGGDKSDPIYGPVTEAINRAYVQGWIDSEIDFVQALGLLSSMGDDPDAIDELWDIAQKKPKTDDAFFYRRDWMEHEYAQEQLKLAGIDPYGKRPKPSTTTPAARAVTNKQGSRAKRK
jgi:hypothetical protein